MILIKTSEDSDKRATTDEIAAKLAAYNNAGTETTSTNNNKDFIDAMADSIQNSNIQTFNRKRNETKMEVSGDIISISYLKYIIQELNIPTDNISYTKENNPKKIIANFNDGPDSNNPSQKATSISLTSDPDPNVSSGIIIETIEFIPNTTTNTTQSDSSRIFLIPSKTNLYESIISRIPSSSNSSDDNANQFEMPASTTANLKEILII